MPTHIALLRGVNVGGNNKVPMAQLREVVASLGHADVATYIQSGNVVFTPAPAVGREAPAAAAMASELEQAIAGALGVRPKVVVVSRDELAEAIRANPYLAEPNPKNVHVVFYADDPGPETAAAVADAQRRVAERGSRDEAVLTGRTLFLHTPDGSGRSELAAILLTRGRSRAAAGTARNWSTVTRLLAMCDT